MGFVPARVAQQTARGGLMDTSITQVSIAELADLAARKAVETGEKQDNPFDPGTADHEEFHRRYCIANLRHSPLPGTEASA